MCNFKILLNSNFSVEVIKKYLWNNTLNENEANILTDYLVQCEEARFIELIDFIGLHLVHWKTKNIPSIFYEYMCSNSKQLKNRMPAGRGRTQDNNKYLIDYPIDN